MRRVQHAHRVNKDGEFIVASERTRTQAGNVADCFEKLHTYIVEASATPTEPSQETRARVQQLYVMLCAVGN